MNAIDATHAPRSITLLTAVSLIGLLAVPAIAQAGTLVHFSTNLGDFDVDLFDDTMPITVANFLAYVDTSRYDSTIIHRSTTYNPADIQIVQGGGYLLSGNQLFPVTTDPPIVLESSTANLRGTLAMARTNDPNSATSEWFFNVTDNPFLDFNYAVFGQIVGASGLVVLDAIAAVPAYDASVQLGPAFSELPLLAPAIEVQNLVLVTSVVAVPEPSTLVLGVAGIAAAAGALRRRTVVRT